MGQPVIEKTLLKLPAYEKFGHFDLLRRVDTGGMAEVVIARERIDDERRRLVALKRLLPQVAADPVFVGMFEDEGRLARLVDHPSVVRAYGFGEIEGQHYLSLEWIHGMSLKDITREAPLGLPVPEAVRILADVAAAVDYTHSLRDETGKLLGVVHRDITPSNVMVGFDGSVKILDFGLAKAATQATSTASGWVKGKLRYLAPEQVHEGGELSWRVDVFTLGLCAFEALVGRPLFDHSDPMEAARAILGYDTTPSLRVPRPDVPPDLEGIVKRALEPDPAYRYHSARRMQAELEAVLGSVEPDFDRDRLGRFLKELFPLEAVAVF